MEKKLTYIVILLLLAVLIFGKYYQNIFPQIVNGQVSTVAVPVPKDWILEKGGKGKPFDFQLVLPSTSLAKVAGFMSGKNIKTSDFKGYVKKNEEEKLKADKNFEKESGFSKISGKKDHISVYICKYSIKDKKETLEAIEFMIYDKKNKSLWHLVGIINEKYFDKNKDAMNDFFGKFVKNNYNTTLSAILKDKKILSKNTSLEGAEEKSQKEPENKKSEENSKNLPENISKKDINKKGSDKEN